MILDFIENQTMLKWFIGILLSIISVLISFVCWYVIKIFSKTEKLDVQTQRNTTKLIQFRESLNESLSKIYTSQQSFGSELLELRRAVDSSRVVLERRQNELDKIVGDADRAKSRMEEIGEALNQHQRIIQAHNSELIKLKNGNIIVKGKKN